MIVAMEKTRRQPATKYARIDDSNGHPSREEIARDAYAIREREGRPIGPDFDRWLQAEPDLRLARPQPVGPNPAAV